MHDTTRKYLIGLMTVLTLTVSVNALAANRVVLGNTVDIPLTASSDPDTFKTLKALRKQAAERGTIRIIAGVRAAFAPEGSLSAAGVAQQRNDIAKMHATVLGKVPTLKSKPGKVKPYSTIPFIAIEVDANELEALAAQSDITSIEEDRLVQPSLAESVPLIGGATALNMGYTGAGQAVAIIDTGVDGAHPFLTSKVVSEACYSTNSGTAFSLCPGGVSSSTAVGSAMPYAGSCPAGKCDHGDRKSVV